MYDDKPDLPRVTEIIKPYTQYDKIPRQILENAASRGTTVHAICAGIAQGAWVPDEMIDEGLKGYVASFKAWSSRYAQKYIIVEKRFTDYELGYTGQLDFVVLAHDGDLWLVDIKTSARHQKHYCIQMAAYAKLLERNHIQISGAMLVYLSKDGDEPKVHTLSDMCEETEVFFSALTCWKYFNEKK